jgi:hypothetical protein
MRDTRLLKRGDWLNPGRSVEPGVPAVLHPLPADAPPTRLTFARWLVDPKSPTTARTFVNRVWQTYFGTGLVATSEDLGTQSEPPSHPALLDWLAVEFVEKGWKQKDLHRLSVSGLLNPKIGGRSVMPPAPAFLFLPPASYAEFRWNEETGADRYRRALYTYRRRSTPFPMLQTFDAPEGTTACVRRARSNTPLQALALLNETVSMEAARAFGLRILEEGGGTDAERLTYAFRVALSRPPSDRERAILMALIEKQKARVSEGWINTHALSTGKDALPPLPEGVTPATLAAYTVAARTLLSLDETITRQEPGGGSQPWPTGTRSTSRSCARRGASSRAAGSSGNAASAWAPWRCTRCSGACSAPAPRTRAARRRVGTRWRRNSRTSPPRPSG